MFRVFMRKHESVILALSGGFSEKALDRHMGEFGT